MSDCSELEAIHAEMRAAREKLHAFQRSCEHKETRDLGSSHMRECLRCGMFVSDPTELNEFEFSPKLRPGL